MEGSVFTAPFEKSPNGSDLNNDSMITMSNLTTTPGLTRGEFMQATYETGKLLPLYKAGYAFEQLNFWMLPILALICNTLTLVTMIHIKPFRSSSLYVSSLAIGDTLVLLLKMLDHIVDILDLDVGDYGCGFLIFLMHVFIHGSIWTIVFMTFERFVAVIFPLKVNSLFTMKRTKISISLIYTFFAFVDAHFIYTYSMRVSPASFVGSLCGHRKGTTYWSYNIWFWINIAFFSGLPCSLLLFLNVIIILGMRASTMKQKKMVLNDAKKKDNQQTQVTVMLLSISFSYIIFFVPVSIFQVWAIDINPFKSPEFFATFHFTVMFVFLFSSMNHAVNFVFYFATNKRFRNVLYQVLCCKDVEESRRYKPSGDSRDTAVKTVSSSVPSQTSGQTSTVS